MNKTTHQWESFTPASNEMECKNTTHLPFCEYLGQFPSNAEYISSLLFRTEYFSQRLNSPRQNPLLNTFTVQCVYMIHNVQ